MTIEPGLYRTLVRTLSPLLLERSRRNYYLNMAFPGQSQYHQVSPDIQDAPLYAQQILTFLSSANPLPGGEEPLLVYLETVRDEVGGDNARTLGGHIVTLRRGATPYTLRNTVSPASRSAARY